MRAKNEWDKHLFLLKRGVTIFFLFTKQTEKSCLHDVDTPFSDNASEIKMFLNGARDCISIKESGRIRRRFGRNVGI